MAIDKQTYVIVEKGDTLSEIAQTYGSRIKGTGIYGSGGKLETLKNINDIENVNYIVVGQEIKLSGSSTAKKNTSSTPKIKVFGIQSNSGGRTMYATWTWSKSNTENYRTIWQYDTGDGVWFNGNDSTTTSKQSLYTAPSNAKRVRFKVLPVSKKRKVNGKETSYWTASWSSYKTYAFSNNPPTTPSGLKAEIPKDSLTLTATLENIDTSVDGINATHVQFRVYRVVNGTNKLFKTSGKVQIVNKYVEYSLTITAGYNYYVEVRAVRGNLYSDWSQMVDAGGTKPSAPAKITKCSATSDTEVYVQWAEVTTASNYTVEYTQDKKYFDAGKVDSQSTTSNFYYITVSESGEWFFRVRATNDSGDSDWSPIKSVILGEAPNAPTTWSSATTAIADNNEAVYLYWTHNTTDESDMVKAEIELMITQNGATAIRTAEVDYSTGKVETEDTGGILDWLAGVFGGGSTDDDDSEEQNLTDYYTLVSTSVGGGATVEWRVRTAGATGVYGAWSITRCVNLFNRPKVEPFVVTDYEDAELEILTQFPVKVDATVAVDANQAPIGYHLAVVSNGAYETVDEVGTAKNVSVGDEVYAKYFDQNGVNDNEGEEVFVGQFKKTLSASDMDLENNIEYTVILTAAMDSGLSCEVTHTFTVEWTDEQYEPNAEILFDEETITTSIRPHCEDADGALINEVLLSVYRREFDGTFTELAKDISNTGYTYITDPHPSLDYARYRIVAKSTITGAISAYDVPGYPIGEKAAILQWDEDWNSFDASIDEDGNYVEDVRDLPMWSGSLLRLPYNIDVSDNNTRDVEMIEYIGRKYPVSYYGTQVGGSSTWSTTIDKADKETLYALRRLAIWMGDVYVREPSGSGYWASVDVSFSQKHCDPTIPVTLTITRVEGGA